MKCLNISYQEKSNNINYEEYYFKGIYIPKNIQLNNKTLDCLDASWKIDDIKI